MRDEFSLRKFKLNALRKMQGRELIIPDSPKEASLKRSYLEDKNRQKVYSISGSSSTKNKKSL